VTTYSPSTPGRTSEDRIVRRLRDMDRRLKRAVRKPQLPHSAIDDGAVAVTSGGQVTGYVGQQYDGTSGYVAVSGPVPPQPGPPLVQQVVGGLRVTATGIYVDPQAGFTSPVVAPLDFARYDVEVSTDPAFPEFADPLSLNSGAVMSPGGGAVKVAWPVAAQTVYVRLRTRSTTGKRSAPSTAVVATTGAVGLGDLGFDLSGYVASNNVSYGTTASASPGIGALWLKEIVSLPLAPKYETYRWTGAAWVLLQDQGVTNALVAAAAAQSAADTKAKVFNQTAAPTYSGAANSAVWFDSDDGNKPYTWSGSAWAPMTLGNGAITPNSLVASNVIATGTVTAALFEAILVLATAVVAGDPTDEHTRLDGTGARAYANDEDGLPVEVGWFGRTIGVRNPDTGSVVASMTENGDISGQTLNVADADPTFGGTLLSETLWEMPWGIVAYGQYPAGTAVTTNTEVGFLELSVTMQPGRMYAIYVENFEPNNTGTAGGWRLRVRSTSDGSTPTTASALQKEYNAAGDVDSAWNTQVPFCFLQTGAALGGAEFVKRFLFCYAAGTGSAVSTGATITRQRNFYVWCEDIGPIVPETGDVVATTSGGTTTKTNYVYEATASWVRTWNQSGSIIQDNEMHQGYGDSFNGIRRAAAGWSSLPSMTGATVQSVEVLMQSYHWWNVSGGTLSMGYHNVSAEPASYPAQVAGSVGTTVFTARSQSRWILCPVAWRTALGSNALKGISILGPSTSATYYGKFLGPASSRPRIRIKYTK
jgi:hypothetical protein